MSRQLPRPESMTAAFVGVLFFFVIVGVFGLRFPIVGLVVFVLATVVVCRVFPAESEEL